MTKKEPFQLSKLLNDNSSKTIILEVQKNFCYYYKKRSFKIIIKAFKKIKKLFNGKFPGFKCCNTGYHDLEHTMDALLATSRLLDGHNLVNNKLNEKLAVNLLVATLLHDTGYVQEVWDNEGTGAKFTANHVERSINFLKKHKKIFKYDDETIDSISRLIKCTGLKVSLNEIDFISPEEKIAGSILGTADLIGQMASRNYIEKLLLLYIEFKEAKIEGFNTEFDMLKKTLDFYEAAEQKLINDYIAVYQYATEHFHKRHSINSNLYMQTIDRHIAYINTILEDDKTNFRHKLKRADWIHDIDS